MRSAAVLNAAKLVAMPLLYTACAHGFGCSADPAFLSFVGTLPASASVYSLTMTKQLSPRIVGPLVPASMLLCVALCGVGDQRLCRLVQEAKDGHGVELGEQFIDAQRSQRQSLSRAKVLVSS